MIKKDCLIIGSGPAGLCAALYMKRANISFDIIDKYMPGGKLANIAEISNFLGNGVISGFELASKMIEDVTSLGVEIGFGDVQSIEKNGDSFLVNTMDEVYETKAVIVATGLSNVPSIKGEKKFYCKGVSYCATCDGALYKGKRVCLIGHNDKVAEEALYLSQLVEKVFVYVDSSTFDCAESLFMSLKEKENVEIVLGIIPIEIKGEDVVTSFLYSVDGEEKEEKVSAIFPLSGEKSASSFLAPLGIKTKNGFIPVNNEMESEVEGLFAIGDVIEKPLRQIVTALNDGAIVSSTVNKYLRKKK